MSKNKKALNKGSIKSVPKPDFSIENRLSRKAKIIIVHALIILSVLLFFSPAFFGGKTVVSGDILNMHSYKNIFEKAENFLWDPYIFLGLPMFGNVGWADFFGHSIDIIRTGIAKLFASDYTGWTIYVMLMGFFFFYLMRHLKATYIISLIVAVAVMFSTGILLLFFIGHITKLLSLIVFPLVILFLLRFNEKIRLLDFLLFILVMHFLFKQWHIQIMFYIFFSVGVFYIYYFLHSVYKKNKELQKKVLISLGAFAIISVIALGMNYYKLKQIYEYTPYSTRGTKSLTDIQNKSEQKTEEEFYDYATNWSFSPGEVLTFLFPSYYGFGSSTYQGPLTRGEEYDVNTYFGQMPFVDVAQYFGIIILFLGIFGIFTRWKEPFVQFLTILIVVCLLLSFGRTFPLLFDLFFHYFPLFDKFRAPSMILNIVQLSFPILAGLGLMKILEIKNSKDLEKEKLIKNIAYVFSGLFIVSLLLSSPISKWFIERIKESGDKGNQLQPLHEYMSNMFMGDVYIALAITAIVFWLAHFFVKNKISFDSACLIILVLIIFDLWRIDGRGFKFVDTAEIEQQFVMPDYIRVIKDQKNNEPYRLLNLKQDGSLGSLNRNNNFHAYFLEEDFYGYSGIKPRSYQDLIEIAGIANPTMWNMLNVKYIITSKSFSQSGMKLIFNNDKSFVYENENELPRAFFVDSIVKAPPMEILNLIKNNSFAPQNVAYIEEGQVPKTNNAAGSSVRIKNYEEEKMVFDAVAKGNNMLFIGTTYYPVGWKARIDGQLSEIYKLNHGFMGVIVPDGHHTVELSFEPSTFYIGRYITLIFSALIFIGLIFAFIKQKNITKE